MQKVFEESKYVRGIKKCFGIAIISILMAVLVTLISYPGFMYADSYSRIMYAQQLLDRANDSYEMWLTPAPSYFMALCLKVTGNIASYTFLQSAVYFFVSMLFIRRIAKKCKILQYIMFFVNPVFYGMAVYFEPSVGCVVGIMGILLILFSEIDIHNYIDIVVTFILLLFCSFVAFGYRANAFTMIPVFLVLIFVLYKENIMRMLLLISLCSGILLVSIVPKAMNIDTMSSVAVSFVWDILNAIGTMEEEQQREYWKYLDDIGGGGGATFDALQNNGPYRVGVWLWFDRLGYKNLSEDGMFEKVLEKYVEFALKEPKALYQAKKTSIKLSLGYKSSLYIDEWQYNCNGRMAEYGYNDSPERMWFYNSHIKAIDWQEFWVKPWVMYVGFIIIFAIRYLFWKIKKEKADIDSCRVWISIFFVACFYYGAFFINTQSYELRYFFPSGCLLMLVNIAMLVDLLADGVKSINIHRK